MQTGLKSIKSEFDVNTTINRLETLVKQNGMTVFLRLNQGLNAINLGMELRPMELLIFGNPKIGTFLMNDNQTIGIDLPMKILAWQNEDGETIITFNDPFYLAERHNLNERSMQTISMMSAMINDTANKIASSEIIINNPPV